MPNVKCEAAQMNNPKEGASSDVRKRAYLFSVKLIQFIDVLNNDLSTTVITKQVLRSATSVGANLIEARGANSRKDFTNFYSYSLKSANETVYWLSLLKDAKHIKNRELLELLDEAKQIANMIGACIVSLKKG
jgi:four helix bundle protein